MSGLYHSFFCIRGVLIVLTIMFVGWVEKNKTQRRCDVLYEFISSHIRLQDADLMLKLIYASSLTKDQNNELIGLICKSNRASRHKVLERLFKYADEHMDFVFDRRKYEEEYDHYRELYARRENIKKRISSEERKVQEAPTPKVKRGIFSWLRRHKGKRQQGWT